MTLMREFRLPTRSWVAFGTTHKSSCVGRGLAQVDTAVAHRSVSTVVDQCFPNEAQSLRYYVITTKPFY